MLPARLAVMIVAAGMAAPAAWAGAVPVVIGCTPVVAARGSTAAIEITLSNDSEAEVGGMQNDLVFDPDVFSIGSNADCVINPAIGPGTAADKTLNTNVNLPGQPDRIRNLIVALGNNAPIPDGALYTCTFDVAADAELRDYTMGNTNVVVADIEGRELPFEATDCVVTVREATPTPTPVGFCEDDEDCPEGQVCVDNRCVTPTPSPTPIGFCEDDEDCPEGQVCIDNRCVTVTPTPIGFCEDDEDCPEGQICVDNRCVTPTPSPTPVGFCNSDDDCPSGQVCVNHMCVAATPTRKSGGGGGCSCKIDPGAPTSRASDLLAVLLPAFVLLLRWRRRRRPS